MKRILLIIPSGGVGGIERLASNFYNYYKSQGYEVKVVKIIKQQSDFINFSEDELFLSELDLGDMGKLSRILFYLKSPFIIRRIIKANKITHSIGFGDVANLFSSLTFTREMKMVSLHGLKSVEFKNNSLLNRLSKIAFKTLFALTDKVVCISEAIKEDLVKNFKFRFPNKLKVIYNPHDIEAIHDLSLQPLDSAKEEKIFEKKTILFIGRLTNQKAPWHLVKSFSLLKDRENVNLIFIGDGVEPVENYIKHLAQKLNISNNIYFLGRKANPYKYLKRANLLALTSYYEGTPNVIIEAIATAVPVVASNCTGGIQELMSCNQCEEKDGFIITESGLITPNFFKSDLDIPKSDHFTDEEHVFSKALELVLKDDSFKKSVITNKELLLQKYNIEVVANEYLS